MDKLNVYFKTLDTVTRPVFRKLREARYRNITCWAKRKDLLNEKIFIRDAKFIEDNKVDPALRCFNWDINTMQIEPVYDGLNHLVSLVEQSNADLNFVCIDNIQNINHRYTLFLDAKTRNDYPKSFVIVPCFQTIEELMSYAQSKQLFQFTLDDTTKFKKCSGMSIQKGACVYQERETGRYWYLDTFHKDHYEVYDSNGKRHLGEADLNGNFNPSKSDSSKQAIK